MANYPEVGKSAYRRKITDGRNAARAARDALGRLDEAGETTRYRLLAKANNNLVRILEVLTELDEIGMKAKNLTTDAFGKADTRIGTDKGKAEQRRNY